jgi:CIC family chloride channel protein
MRSYYLQTKAQLDKTLALNIKNIYLLIMTAIGGIAIGLMIAGIRLTVSFMQNIIFGTNINLQNVIYIASWRIVCVTVIGGMLLGLLLAVVTYFKCHIIVDPVEANALKGGHMSLRESLTLVGLSMWSIIIGGSVGFEAAVTQLGAGFLSFIGQKLMLERRDLRILVSCGTGAGLAAIFSAPLAGTFYALELVVGGYALRALMPTLLASAMSSLVIYIVFGFQPIFLATIDEIPSLSHVPLAITIGFMAALVGITVMRGTTGFETFLSAVKLPIWLRPALGGLLLGLIIVQQPLVIGPSHGGINLILAEKISISSSALLLLAKIVATIVCIGTGFRGGLFSASLLLGAALGYIVHYLLIIPLFGHGIAPDLTIIAGMAGVAASIIGTPMAIVLLMVETAGLHSGIITSAITVVTASYLTKRWFGYSFSTWRFHIRGSNLEGPRDVARLRELTLNNLTLSKTPPLVNHDILITLSDDTCLDEYLIGIKDYPLSHIAVLNNRGHLLGYTSQQAILKYYLAELLLADYDERA